MLVLPIRARADPLVNSGAHDAGAEAGVARRALHASAAVGDHVPRRARPGGGVGGAADLELAGVVVEVGALQGEVSVAAGAAGLPAVVVFLGSGACLVLPVPASAGVASFPAVVVLVGSLHCLAFPRQGAGGAGAVAAVATAASLLRASPR